ncbi:MULTISPECIES: hypothetical protein [Sphingomonas]|uniref:STAS/SEC14 domain-containing protein n=1 Tax=Sphingomonas bisphenolicum TaxID=296544 RepID=A0ABM7G6X4_9SPHN|nr:hypothetical protein [Sphingomonas bisphenolicum]BBF70469.1 hypothetical protein SBA_ch1_26690 [Sphingomonas bisphenolicum]
MFHVEYDPRANCLMMKVEGFWNADNVVALAKEVGAKANQAKAIRDDFNVIVESFEFPVQANDVADLLAGIMRGGMTLTSGRTAVVVGSQLNRAQAERTLVHPRVRVFLTMEEAQAWVAEEADLASAEQVGPIPPAG